MEVIFILVLYFNITKIFLILRDRKYLPMFYGFLFAVAITAILYIFDMEEELGLLILIPLLSDFLVLLTIAIVLAIIIIIFDHERKTNQKFQNAIKKFEPLIQFIVTSFVILFIEAIIFFEKYKYTFLNIY